MLLPHVSPPLIDNMVHTHAGLPDGRWVIAKPCSPTGWYGLVTRLNHALLVLRGRATAVIFDEDIKDIQ